MRAPSLASFARDFPKMDPCDAQFIRNLVRNVDDRQTLAHLIETSCPDTHRWRMSCFNDPLEHAFSRREIVLHAIDRILGTHGVEGLGPTDNDPHFEPRYSYCNAGDPYVATLIYSRDSDRLFIGAWGDIVEKEDPNGEW